MRLFATLPEMVEVGGRTLPLVATRYKAARGIRLKPCAVSGAIKLSLPARGGVREALNLLETHRGWLEAQVARWPTPLPFAPGAEIPFDGRVLLLDWDEARPLRPMLEGTTLRLGGPRVGVADRTRRFLMQQARAALVPMTHDLAAAQGCSVARVALGDPVGRWGSCNQRQASINYSWRLILMPEWVRRAIVVHEVAHLVHAHHGPEFWRLVADMGGQAGESRRWLARFGREMHAVGAGSGQD
jgi:predicted metal-dependent hydrolase